MPGPTRRRAIALGASGLVGLLASCARPAPPGRGASPPLVDPALGAPTGAPLRRGTVVDARAHGVRGDGRSDDTDALADALAAARTQPGPATVALEPGTFLVRADGTLRPGSGTTLAGVPGRTTLRLVRPGAGPSEEFGVGVLVEGADVTLDGLVLERGDDTSTVMVRLGRCDRVTLSRTALLGHAEAYARPCHGVQAGTAGGVSTALAVTDSVVSACDYGFFQANDSTAVTVGVQVARCTFARNAATDLEFNSPSGSFRGVRVEDCVFRDNDSPGFAVGVAYGADVVVTGCRMTNYRMEAVHVEDWSTAVRIEDNTFTACGLREFAHVQVISGSSQVRITGNVHDATMNRAPIAVVGALPGGSGTTAGGRSVSAPTDVSVVGNRMMLAPVVDAVSLDGVVGGAVLANRVERTSSPPPRAVFRVVGGNGVTVAGNLVDGRPA